MKKPLQNGKDFNIEILLVIITLVLIGIASFLIYRNDHNSAPGPPAKNQEVKKTNG